MWIFWLILMIVCLLAEVASVNMTTLWFALGALAAMATTYLTDSLAVQILVFFFFSALGLFLFLKVFKARFQRKSDAQRTNADRIIGEHAVVQVPIVPYQEGGQVLVLGQVWSALAQDKGMRFDVGAQVTVTAIRGVHAIVQQIDQA